MLNKAKKLIKFKNITTMDQIERTFKSSAYYAWNMLNVDSEVDSVRGSSIVSSSKGRHSKKRIKNNGKRNDHSNIYNGSNQDMEGNMADQTLVPSGTREQIKRGKLSIYI